MRAVRPRDVANAIMFAYQQPPKVCSDLPCHTQAELVIQAAVAGT